MFRIILSVIFIFLILQYVNIKDSIAHISSINLIFFLYAIIIEWLILFIETYRLYLMSKKKFSKIALLKTRVSSILVSPVLPGFGASELIRILFLDMYKPGNKIYIANLFFMNRFYGFCALFPLLIYGISTSSFTHRLYNYIDLVSTFSIVLCLSPLLLNNKFIFRMIISLRKISVKFLRKILRIIYLSIEDFCSLRIWFLALGTSMIVNFMIVVQIYFIAKSVGIIAEFSLWFLVIPLLAVVIFLPLGIGGVGPQEALLIAVAKASNQSVEAFLALSILIHLCRYISVAPCVCFLKEVFSQVKDLKLFKKKIA